MCDTWVALRDATLSRKVIFAKNSDRPIFDCQPLMLYPRQNWPHAGQIQLEYLSLPQIPQTYATLGSSPYWAWGYEEGINEYGLVIGNEAIYTKTFKQQVRAYQANEAAPFGLLAWHGFNPLGFGTQPNSKASGRTYGRTHRDLWTIWLRRSYEIAS
jgi:secernin